MKQQGSVSPGSLLLKVKSLKTEMIESFLDNLGDKLPFGYSFSAGMVTSVNPCGVAMLPAYVSFHLGSRGSELRSQSVHRRIARALLMSGMVTLAFVMLFGILGIVVSAGGQPIFTAVPWVAVAIGAILILLGLYLLSGGHLYTSLPNKLAGHLGSNSNFGIRGSFLFGMGYGISALSCALPVFLVVIGGAIAVRGTASGLFQFISYALGMGFVMTVLTLGSVLFRETVSRWLNRLVPVIVRINGILLVLAGIYIIHYWFTEGEIIG